MKNKNVQIGLAVVLGSVAATPACTSDAQNKGGGDRFASNKNRNTDSLNLEKRLRELAKTKYTGELAMGAMCYEAAMPTKMDYTCPVCGSVISETYDSWLVHEIRQIQTLVHEIKANGYDVVLDPSEFCSTCCGSEIKNPSLIFKIRYSKDAPYHTVKSNITNEYQCLLAFIKGENTYMGDNGFEETLHDNIAIIQKMTGLGKDLITSGASSY